MAQTSLESRELKNQERRRHSTAKSHGVHYTPPELARFVARRALPKLARRARAAVLDPACGDGELLSAVAAEAANAGLPQPELVGIDRDPQAILAAERRLADAPAATVALHCEDFLQAGPDASGAGAAKFDLVISNPPYVRTQVLGAARAQELARQFGLKGRVDLYHAFVAGITATLAENGTLALLCSNRFLTTKGGHSLRALLEEHYEIAELWDLGDSKLFSAAVLPAVVVARLGSGAATTDDVYVRVYEAESNLGQATTATSLFKALEDGREGDVKVETKCFAVERGRLEKPKGARPWRLATPGGTRWLERVKVRAAGRFGDLGPIRVGIKTTADKVFIRASWDELPPEIRPERSLLHPLITHHVASRWQAKSGAPARMVLYTHEVVAGKKQPIALPDHPRAAAYLEQHRERLEGRGYVRKAKRAWYEIWVPQQPDGWAAPKLVWPDIAEAPRFFLDESGAIVNGDCYWQSCGDASDEERALALAVANSSFALRYYDLCCGNRLYAGRRRFITQYLEELPLPSASQAAKRDIPPWSENYVNRLTIRTCVRPNQPWTRRSASYLGSKNPSGNRNWILRF